MASLILRYYDPDQGSVSIGGEDIRNMDPYQLRQKIGIVSQVSLSWS